jgi:hypothetical protein
MEAVLGIVVSPSLASQALKGPGSVFTDDGIRMLGSPLEPGHKPFVAGIAYGHREIAQPAAPLRPLDGRMNEDPAEVFFAQQNEGLQRWVEQRKASCVSCPLSVVRGPWPVVRSRWLASTAFADHRVGRLNNHRVELRKLRNNWMRRVTPIGRLPMLGSWLLITEN